jgi:hypothetical protein
MRKDVIVTGELPRSWFVLVFVILWAVQNLFVPVPGGTSTFREFSKRRNEATSTTPEGASMFSEFRKRENDGS